MEFRRWVSVCLLVALLLCGCTQEGVPETESQPTVPLPGSKEPVKLTIAVPSASAAQDHDSNGYTLWLEAKTGYDLEFVVMNRGVEYPADPLLEAEKLPDILWGYHADPARWSEYGQKGLILDLSPYFQDREGKSRMFWQRLEKLPQEERIYLSAIMTGENGGIYTVPGIEYSMTDTMAYQVFINREWLEVLHLDMPNSPETLRRVLEAFRDGDPNGNGEKDEIPMVGSRAVDGGDILLWIINMFTPCSNSRFFNIDRNGSLYLAHKSDAYRQALIYIRGLMEDGLLNPSFFSLSRAEYYSLVNPKADEAVTVGIWAGDPETVPEEGCEAIFAYEGLPLWGNAVRTENKVSTAVCISADCQAPDAAWELIMLMCSEEGSLRMRYGVKGLDWMDADGVSYIGTDITLKVLNGDAFSGPGNATWGEIYGTVFIAPETTLQYDADRDTWNEKRVDLMMAGFFIFNDRESRQESGEDRVIQRVAMSDGKATRDCIELIFTAMEGFCCGTGEYNDPRSDAQWDAYLSELELLGCETWLEACREAYRLQYPDQNELN